MGTDHASILDAWRITDRATRFLVERIPPELWGAALSRSPLRTVRSIAAHLHNSRCMWMRGLGGVSYLSIPPRANRLTATPRAVSAALRRSGLQIVALLQAGLANGGHFPDVPSRFVWGAWPRNVTLFLAYAVSHEAHHRGQILLMARELGQRLPPRVVRGLWRWSSRLKESRPKRTAGT